MFIKSVINGICFEYMNDMILFDGMERKSRITTQRAQGAERAQQPVDTHK